MKIVHSLFPTCGGLFIPAFTDWSYLITMLKVMAGTYFLLGGSHVFADSLVDSLPQHARFIDGAVVKEEHPKKGDVWYRRESLVPVNGQPGTLQLHGVRTEHHSTSPAAREEKTYTAIHVCHYDGKPGVHRVVASYRQGSLSRVDYFLGEVCALTRQFDAFGREIPDPVGARGAKHKRQQILRRFEEVYGKFNP